MKTFILALATALPQYQVEQTRLAQKIIQNLELDKRSAQYVENLYNKTKITRRFIIHDLENDEFFNKDFMKKIPTTQERNEIYIKKAPQLAKAAALKAMQNSNINPENITHVISVSCTGMMAPGIEFILAQELGLPNTVQRIGINFMGCFGAFRGLAVANAIAAQNPKHRILVVCTEICSLHMQITGRPEVLIGNALFADGAAAVVVGAEPTENETPIYEIIKAGSCALQNTQNKMTWTVSDTGFVMTLDKDIPALIEQNAQKILADFLQTDEFNNFNWAIHPGGKSIIEAIERSCKLEQEKSLASWKVLNDYGNMSSATFLFVLEQMAKKQNDKTTVGVGFGPGLSMETILLGPVK